MRPIRIIGRHRSKNKARRKPGRSFCDLSNNNPSHVYNARAYCEVHPFLITKATQGINFIDRLHGERCESTHLQDRAIGHYHFIEMFSDSREATAEAEHFFRVIKPHFGRRDFCIIDIETAQTVPNEVIKAFESRLYSLLKHLPLCYTNLDYFQEHSLYCRSGKWWLADYGGSLPLWLSRKQKLWAHQYSDKGRCLGIGGPVDMNLLIDKSSIRYWNN